MRRFLPIALALLAVGCGSGRTPYAPSGFGGALPTPTPAPGGVDTFPDFNITPPPVTFPAPTLGADGTQVVALTVRTNASVDAPIALSLQNPPAGVSATFSPASVSPSSSPIPVTMTLRVADPSQPGSVQILGRSGSVERLSTVSYRAYVAPSGFTVAVAPVAGQSNGNRTRLFDVTVSQTSGSGEISLSVDRSDRTGNTGIGILPIELPAAASVTGLPDFAILSGTTSQTFRLSVTLPEGALNFYYGFAVRAARGTRTEKAAIAFPYTGASLFDLSVQISVSGNVDTVRLTYTPRNAEYSGTLVVERAPDGDLGSQGGQNLATLPSGTVVGGLPQTLTFDGTGASRTAVFTVTAPAGTPSTTYYGIRVKASPPGNDATTESVLLLQFGIGGQ